MYDNPKLTSPAPMRFNGATGTLRPTNWALICIGPSTKNGTLNDAGVHVDFRGFINNEQMWNLMTAGDVFEYDPSNGTRSSGNIWRTQ